MRTPITLKIKFKSGSLDQFIERYSVDVSRGGIFIRTKEPLPVGTSLKFEFQLQDASALISGEGTVVWTREPDPTRTGVAPGMGVRFDKLSSPSQGTLEKILTEKTKRGEAAVESRFDAGVRASQAASGGFDERDTKTPLPMPMPGLTDQPFSEESTRVMNVSETRALADKTRGQDEEGEAKHDPGASFDGGERTVQIDSQTVQNLLAGTRPDAPMTASEVGASGGEAGHRTPPPPPKSKAKVEAEASAAAAAGSGEAVSTVVSTPSAELLSQMASATKEQDAKEAKSDSAAEKAGTVDSKPVKVVEAAVDEKTEKVKATPVNGKSSTAPRAAETRTATVEPPRRASTPPARKSKAPTVALLVVAMAGSVALYYALSDKPDDPSKAVVTPQTVPPTTNPTVAANPTTPPTTPPSTNPTVTNPPTTNPTTPPENKTPEVKAVENKTAEPVKTPEAVVKEPEKTPEAPKIKTVSVEVTTTPPGATVTLNGNPVDGVTPLQLADLDPDKSYEVRATMKGFKEAHAKIAKPKAGAPLSLKLTALEKLLEITSTPAGADVLVDGKKVGRTPTKYHVSDATKSHAVQVKRSGFVSAERTVSASDAYESKGDKEILALAFTLEAEKKADKPKAHTTKSTSKPESSEKPSEKPAETKAEKPAETKAEKPAETKVEKPAETKPVKAETKPEKTEAKPEKTEAKPAEKPAETKGDGEGPKIPAWMKKKNTTSDPPPANP